MVLVSLMNGFGAILVFSGRNVITIFRYFFVKISPPRVEEFLLKKYHNSY